MSLRNFVGVFQLAHDFGLADDHRLEARCDRVQVLHAGDAAQLERKGGKILRYFVKPPQKIRPRGSSAFRLRRRSEILHPVTGGEEDRFLQPEHLFHLLERFWDLPRAKGDLFPQSHGHVLEG